IFTDRENYRDKPGFFERYWGNDPDAFFIDEGGASALGVKGASELVDELTESYDHIFCACGTGTTAAGIISGLTRHRLATQFHGIPVLKNGEFLRKEIDQYLDEPSDYRLHTDYHFGGYGKTTDELIQFIKHFTASTGILIDPVYTGKMMYAIYDLATKNYFSRGSRVLAIHTGGIWGLLGMKDKFR
ncbi:MAG TPA: pyridoxal-phosphate dependent enzyme, partial [Mucilaginibacter sp.]|nr:pyridoxal-phosphate dependent enzyme [Mucilaginibacter sp.]